ncbi:MAG: hypothetical protein PVI67_10220 [Anaerolineae bacterium]|jgi:hypothetical protein
MIDHFSPIGFRIKSEDHLLNLMKRAEEDSEVVSTPKGTYFRWSGESGAELWLQGDRRNRFIGGSPHFSGTSQTKIGLAARVKRPDDNALEGAFRAWAEPSLEDPESGIYPFVFDAPDFAVYSDVQLPSLATASISAFAEEIAVYDSAESFLVSQSGEHKIAAQSFFPLGLFPDEERRTTSLEARAMFSGHVLDAERRVNRLSLETFIWVLVETFGGAYDVVFASNMLDEVPVEGNLVSGTFWLSGRLLEYDRQEPRGLKSFLRRR